MEKMTLMDLWDTMCDINEPNVDLQASFLDTFGIVKQPAIYIDSLLKTLINEEMSKRESKIREDPFKNVVMTLLKYIEVDTVIEYNGVIDDPAFWDLLMLIETDYTQEEFNSRVNDYFDKTLSDYASSSIFTQSEKDIIVSRLKFLYKLYEDLDDEISDNISFAVKYGYYDDNYRLSTLIKLVVEILYAMEAAHRVRAVSHDGNENMYKDESFKNIKTKLFLIFKNEMRVKIDIQRMHEFHKFAVVENSNEHNSSDVVIGYTSDVNLDRKLNEYAKDIEEVNKTYKLIKLK